MDYRESPYMLDRLLGLRYCIACGEPVACMAKPRERSFIVVEDHGVEIKPSGKLCAYIVAKRGLSTPDALRLLAKLTGRKPHAFTALGLKDAEATTLQLVCGPCPRGGERRWVVAGGRLWAKVAGYVDGCPRKPKANRFHIVLEPLAGVKASSVVEAAARLKARLPAYYGYQRFGTRRPVTHLLGASLLRGELDTFAATLLGEPHPDESPPTVECRLRAWKGCTGRLLEAKLAPYADRVTDLLRRIPRGLIEIFGGALQAYIFNEYLSARISYGYDLGERLRGERLAADGRPLAPVPGIGYKVGVSGEARTLIREALSAAGLDERDLENRLGLLPKLRPYWRPTYTAAADMSIRQTGSGGSVLLSFRMESGMYATILLRELVLVPDCI